jgi:hypothetical protein
LNRLKISLSILAIAALGLTAVSSAIGAQISGTIDFTTAPNLAGGFVTGGGGTTTVHFNNPLHVDFATGDYSSTVGQPVNFNSIAWTGSGTSSMLTSSNSPEWAFTIGATTYSFDLLSLESTSFAQAALDITGHGRAHITGFADTFGTFSFHGTGHEFIVSMVVAAAAPEGGSAIALLGVGLFAVEGLRRRLANA